MMEHMQYFDVEARRISLTDPSVQFPHREDPEFVKILHNEQLGRNIVWVTHLRQFFPLELECTWEGISPGTYKVMLRMMIGVSAGPYSETFKTDFVLKWPGPNNGYQDLKERTNVASNRWWDLVSHRNTTRKEREAGRMAGWVAGGIAGRVVGGAGGQVVGQLAGRAVGGRAVQAVKNIKRIDKVLELDGLTVEWEEYDKEMTDWCHVELIEIEVGQIGTVIFSLRDERPLGWAGDLILDFVELRRVR